MISLLIPMLVAAFAPHFSFAQEDAVDPPLLVQDVKCVGNVKTSCDFIASHLYLSPGDSINEKEIQSAKLRLSSVSKFKSADIRLEKGFEVGKASVVIEVVEADSVKKEFALGTVLENSSLSQRIAGRISHHDLFGAGKILELELAGQVRVSGPIQSGYASRLQYIDPSLFGSKKYFLVAGLSQEKSGYEEKDGYNYEFQKAGADISLGQRNADSSYFTIGYQHLLTSRYSVNSIQTYNKIYRFGYGWNTEDDTYFPTQGSRFGLSLALATSDGPSSLINLGFGYQRTWTTVNNKNLTLHLGSTPGPENRRQLDDDLHFLGLAYSGPIAASESFGGISRGRWYIEPGIKGFSYSAENGTTFLPGVKTGVRLDTKAFGIVDLYALATTEINAGRGK